MPEEKSAALRYHCKVWVEGTELHVHSHMHIHDEASNYQLEKRELQGNSPDELLLEIIPAPVAGDQKVKINYHEDLQEPDHYKKIIIYAGSEQLIEITDIGRK